MFGPGNGMPGLASDPRSHSIRYRLPPLTCMNDYCVN
jgi:hypothetical protein